MYMYLVVILLAVWWLFPLKKSVKNDVVLITGGSMGIGRLMALEFARLGAVVVIWDINPEHGSQVVEEIHALGGKARFDQIDVTDRAKVYSTGASVLEQFNGIDILINNAGVVGGKSILDSDDEMIERTMNVNATCHAWTIKMFLPGMVKRNKGNIVSISSAAGVFGCGGMCDYSASKAATLAFMVSLRQELVELNTTNVHSTIICPSFIKTGMFEGVQAPLFVPWMMPEYVAKRVVTAVQRNEFRVYLPRILYLFDVCQTILPDPVMMGLVKLVGLTRTMTRFEQTRPHAQIKPHTS